MIIIGICVVWALLGGALLLADRLIPGRDGAPARRSISA